MWLGRIAGAGSGALFYKLGVSDPAIFPSIVSGAVLGAAGGATIGRLRTYREDHSTEQHTETSKEVADANADINRTNSLRKALRNLRDSEDPDFSQLIERYDKELREKVNSKGSIRAAIMDILEPKELVADAPAAVDTDDDADTEPDTLVGKARARLQGLTKGMGGHALRGAGLVSAGVLAAAIFVGPGEEEKTRVIDTNQVDAGSPADKPTTITLPESTDQFCVEDEKDTGLLPAGSDDLLGAEVERDGKKYQVISVLVTPEAGPVFSINCLKNY